MNYTTEEIKKAFWDTFHESGELWFNNCGTKEENEKSTNKQWKYFIEALATKTP